MLSLKNDPCLALWKWLRWESDMFWKPRISKGYFSSDDSYVGAFSGWWFEECAGCFRVNVSLPPPHLPHKCPCGNRLGVAPHVTERQLSLWLPALWKEATHIDTVVSQLFNDRTGITRHPPPKHGLNGQTNSTQREPAQSSTLSIY